ncbi:hypothetical protein JKP88DRAFT_251649 [Tribonema minus]|uniref:Uncharacterized protein n=1 Tax=Tribonema minus TaxID=303371 RepID=A0A836CLU6_9STRA|nr:hypothetical protein JKP88DRAFT_251649 [Tribonema minus]
MCDVHRETTGHDVWHWSKVGLDILVDAGYVDDLNEARYQAIQARRKGKPFGEYGLDGISIDADGVHHGLQAKIRKTRKLRERDVATFLSVVLCRLVQNDWRTPTVVAPHATLTTY